MKRHLLVLAVLLLPVAAAVTPPAGKAAGQQTIQITDTADQATVSAGSQIGFTITVTNPSTKKTDISIFDDLPNNPGTSWSINPANPNCSLATNHLCDVSGLAAGSSFSVHVVSPTTAASCGTAINRVKVGSSNLGGVSAPAVSVTIQCATLHVTKVADASAVSAGGQVGYTITGSNAGPGAASGFTLRDPLPGGVTWALDTAHSDSTCSIATAAGAQTLTCGGGTLAANASVSAHVTGTAGCGTISNTASVSAGNAATASVGPVTVAVNCLPDLVIQSVAFTSGSPFSGSPYSYTATVKNQGATADVSGVAVQGYYAPTAGTWPGDQAACGSTFPQGTSIAAGGTAQISIGCNAAPLTGDDWLNVKVNYESQIAESDTTNNVGGVQLPRPDLVIQSMSIAHPSNYPVDSYTVTVKNQGNATADLSGVGIQGYYGTSPTSWPTNDPACGTSFGQGITLAPGATIDIVVGCAADIPGADDYLVAKVDSTNIVAERNEDNNLGSIFMPIQ